MDLRVCSHKNSTKTWRIRQIITCKSCQDNPWATTLACKKATWTSPKTNGTQFIRCRKHHSIQTCNNHVGQLRLPSSSARQNSPTNSPTETSQCREQTRTTQSLSVCCSKRWQDKANKQIIKSFTLPTLFQDFRSKALRQSRRTFRFPRRRIRNLWCPELRTETCRHLKTCIKLRLHRRIRCLQSPLGLLIKRSRALCTTRTQDWTTSRSRLGLQCLQVQARRHNNCDSHWKKIGIASWQACPNQSWVHQSSLKTVS